MLLFSVMRSMTPPNACPSTYLSYLSFSDGLVSLCRTQEPLLPHPHLGMRLPVNGHRGRKPVVDVCEGPGELVFLDLRHQVLKRPRLMA